MDFWPRSWIMLIRCIHTNARWCKSDVMLINYQDNYESASVHLKTVIDLVWEDMWLELNINGAKHLQMWTFNLSWLNHEGFMKKNMVIESCSLVVHCGIYDFWYKYTYFNISAQWHSIYLFSKVLQTAAHKLWYIDWKNNNSHNGMHNGNLAFLNSLWGCQK